MRTTSRQFPNPRLLIRESPRHSSRLRKVRLIHPIANQRTIKSRARHALLRTNRNRAPLRLMQHRRTRSQTNNLSQTASPDTRIVKERSALGAWVGARIAGDYHTVPLGDRTEDGDVEGFRCSAQV